jgi:replicative DNA helicase
MPPVSLEAEQSVLGAILLRAKAMDEISDLLRPEDFYRPGHGRIYQAMLYLYGRNEPVDLVTVSLRLEEMGQLDKVGGRVFLAQLSEHVGTAANIAYYAKVVQEKSILRRLLEASQQIVAECLGGVEDVSSFLDSAESRIFQVMDNQQIQAHPLAEIVPSETALIEALYGGERKPTGIPSGFIDMDNLTLGFQDSDLIIIAARPSMGKTALALNISQHAARNGYPGVFFSLEMSKEQLVRRLMASGGRIGSRRLRTGKLEAHEWSSLFSISGELIETPIFIADKATATPLEIRSLARRMKSRHGIRWVIIDYLQLINDPRARSREQEVAGISRSLKSLAKELQMPVIALSQLNRKVEERKDRHPLMADLRESGAIEQDADLIFFIYRDEVYNENTTKRNIAEIELAKQRNGATGKFDLTYIPEFTKFENYIGDCTL